MIRFVKLVPAAENPPVVIPAPKMSLVRCGRGDRTAVAGRAGSRCGGTDIKRVHRVKTAVFRNADINIRRRGVEGNCHSIGPGGSRFDILGVVDGLANGGTARDRDSDLIDVTRGVRYRGDVGGNIVPSDRENVGIPRDLRTQVCHCHLVLTGLWSGGIHLYQRQRRG